MMPRISRQCTGLTSTSLGLKILRTKCLSLLNWCNFYKKQLALIKSQS